MSKLITDKELKQNVANAVFNLVTLGGIPDAKLPVEGAMSVETQRISPLVLSIRVKTLNAGTHYYTVKVTEQL